MAKWHHYDCSQAVGISQERRQELVQEVRNYLDEHPDEPFYYISSGNALVIGVRSADLVTVFHTILVEEYLQYPEGT